MKSAALLSLFGAATLGMLLSGEINPAHATPLTVTFNSDYQTYVVSGTQKNGNSGGKPNADTSFYGKGAMEISAAVADPAVGYTARTMDALISFNTASFLSQFDTQFGAGKWAITSAAISLSTNWTGQGVQPSNPDFNAISTGKFTFDVLGGDPNLTTTTWNTLQSYLATTTASSVGTFNWDATQKTGSDGYVHDSYSLIDTASLTKELLSGEFTLLGLAADDAVGYVFNTKNRLPPTLTLTVDAYQAPAPVPEPSSIILSCLGMVVLIAFKRRSQPAPSLA